MSHPVTHPAAHCSALGYESTPCRAATLKTQDTRLNSNRRKGREGEGRGGKEREGIQVFLVLRLLLRLCSCSPGEIRMRQGRGVLRHSKLF